MFDSGPQQIHGTIVQEPTRETTFEDREGSAEIVLSRQLLGFNTISDDKVDSGVNSARKTQQTAKFKSEMDINSRRNSQNQLKKKEETN